MIELAGKQIYDSVEEMAQPGHTALVVVDVTNDFCAPDGYFAKEGYDTSMILDMMPSLLALLASAREAGVLVIHVQNTVLPNGLSDSGAFIRFKSKHVGRLPVYTVKGTRGWEFFEGFEPVEGEPVISKHRPSAFVSTDLDRLLRVARHRVCGRRWARNRRLRPIHGGGRDVQGLLHGLCPPIAPVLTPRICTMPGCDTSAHASSSSNRAKSLPCGV